MRILLMEVMAIMVLGTAGSTEADRTEVERLISAENPAYRTVLLDYIKLAGMHRPPGRPAPGTRKVWENRRREIRSKFLESLGLSPLPRRTALKARITGVLDRPGYRVEKLVFESRPRFYVTSNLYIPKGRKLPAPAILCPHGHRPDAKGSKYQELYIGLAKKGYVVLALDGVGFGERWQTGHRCQAAPYVGGQCIAGLEIWDNIRALDYLCSRPEVDRQRIGITGSSGGGLQILYTIAVDDRLTCAVPVDFVTTYNAFLGTGIIHCICNHVPNIMRYADMADLLSTFAPKPLRIVCGEFDPQFPAEGARQTFERVKEIYRLYGAESNVTLHVSPTGHGFELDKRQAAYEWFNKWLGNDADAVEPDIEIESPETLFCFEGGRLPDPHETVATLSHAQLAELSARRVAVCPGVANSAAVERLRSSIIDEVFGGFPNRCPLNARVLGKSESERFSVERIVFDSETHMPIPALLFVPEEPQSECPAVVYVDPRGKAAAAQSDGVERLLDLGFAVLAVDCRGYGETYDPRGAYQGESEYLAVTDSVLLGRHLFGMRVWDIIRSADYLLTRKEIDPARIGCAGEGIGGLLALFAGALDERFAWVATSGMLCTYVPEKEWLDGSVPWGWQPGKYDKVPMSAFIPNILKHADIPDVARLIVNRPLLLDGPADGTGQELTDAQVKTKFGALYECYAEAGCDSSVLLAVTTETQSRDFLVPCWWQSRAAGR